MIYKYEIIAPITNRKNPYIDSKDFFIVPDFKKIYRYYIEVKRYNLATLNYEYFLLLSDTKFDIQCRKCRVDDYCRLKVKLHGDIKDYTIKEVASRGNVEFNYIESEQDYDVWQIV